MRRLSLALGAACALALPACAQEKVDTRSGDSASVERGADLFNERCSGCHTLDAAGAQGSKPEGAVEGGERTNGPNFNTKNETTDDVLFAIRNGGFSGAIMPANIVVGDDAEAVAEFVCRYGGGYDAERDCSVKPVPPIPEDVGAQQDPEQEGAPATEQGAGAGGNGGGRNQGGGR